MCRLLAVSPLLFESLLKIAVKHTFYLDRELRLLTFDLAVAYFRRDLHRVPRDKKRNLKSVCTQSARFPVKKYISPRVKKLRINRRFPQVMPAVSRNFISPIRVTTRIVLLCVLWKFTPLIYLFQSNFLQSLKFLYHIFSIIETLLKNWSVLIIQRSLYNN